jgi:hypothetical protein
VEVCSTIFLCLSCSKLLYEKSWFSRDSGWFSQDWNPGSARIQACSAGIFLVHQVLSQEVDRDPFCWISTQPVSDRLSRFSSLLSSLPSRAVSRFPLCWKLAQPISDPAQLDSLPFHLAAQPVARPVSNAQIMKSWIVLPFKKPYWFWWINFVITCWSISAKILVISLIEQLSDDIGLKSLTETRLSFLGSK